MDSEEESSEFSNIKQIYIGNILESYYKNYDSLDEDKKNYWIEYDTTDNNRCLLYGGDNKILITPKCINTTHQNYICDLAGWKNVHNFFPSIFSNSICEDITKDEVLLGNIVSVIKNNPEIEIIPYRNTKEYYALIKYLKSIGLIFQTPESMPEEELFIDRYYHSKRGFRHLWSMISNCVEDISIPLGFITSDINEALESAYWFKVKNKDFVLKYNRGVQGIGVEMFDVKTLPETKEAFLMNMRGRLNDGMWKEPCIIVEEKISADRNVFGGTPSIELRILPDGSVIDEYACEQIMEPDGKTFMGVGIGNGVSHNELIDKSFRAGELFGKELSSYGYRGFFDIDLVISKEGKLYAVESNIRRTGGTHIHEFSKQLLGEDYFDHYYVMAWEIAVTEEKYTKYDVLLNSLSDYLYDDKTHQGFLFVNPDMARSGVLQAMLIGDNKMSVVSLSKKIENIVSKI